MAFLTTSITLGYVMQRVGRRFFFILGFIFLSVGMAGFCLSHYFFKEIPYVIAFLGCRVVIGVGTSMVQTTSYAILAMRYPDKVSKLVGMLELSAGAGLCIGPAIGSLLYKIQGFPLPFWTFCCIFIVMLFISLIVMPKEVKEPEPEETLLLNPSSPASSV